MSEVQCQKCDNFDQNIDFPDDDCDASTNKRLVAIRQFVRNKLYAIKSHNYQISNIKLFAKFIRRKLNLNKAPKKKGYGRYFTDEEKR